LSIPMLLSKWILRQNIRNMSGQTMSAWMDREFLQWRYLIKTIFNISKWATSRDIVIWLLQGTIYINMSIILSFNCGNSWTQWSHFYFLKYTMRRFFENPKFNSLILIYILVT
jgi:hypothetical protein